MQPFQPLGGNARARAAGVIAEGEGGGGCGGGGVYGCVSDRGPASLMIWTAAAGQAWGPVLLTVWFMLHVVITEVLVP